MYITVPSKQRAFLKQILWAIPYRAPAGVLRAFSRNGWSTGDAGGHQLTELGRRVAELSEGVAPGDPIRVEQIDGLATLVAR